MSAVAEKNRLSIPFNDQWLKGGFSDHGFAIQRDDGRWTMGLHDDGPGFETRRFAESVAARTARVFA
jgi:hypothetical protein